MTAESTISFHSEDTIFELKDKRSVQNWIQEAISTEGKIMGDIAYVFCSDNYLHKINLEYLQHDTFTDIITFNYCEDNVISADIFISVDRVKENAESFNTAFQSELSRVMIHGVLHLLGYDDKSDSERELMRSKEDFYLSLQS